MQKLNILFEDKDIIVCHKAAAVAVQTKNVRQMDMERMLLNEQNRRGETPEIHIVHRLDQPVEGIIVFAKNKKSAANLSGQFKSNNLSKEYLAVVANGFDEREVHLEDYLLKNQRENRSQVVIPGTKGAKAAILDLTVIADKENSQLIAVHLKTGRHHQIRVQLSNAGCPILGDTKYNPDYIGKKGFFQTALCAHKLTFLHPKTLEEMSFTVKPMNKEFEIYQDELDNITV